jgi:subtilisin family serine protease
MLASQWGWLRIHCDHSYGTGFRGLGVIVAMLDTGVDTKHPDLKDNIVAGYNFVDNNDNVTDTDGHGTMTAGIIAATANNSIGIAGVAPEVKIMPLKIVSNEGGTWVDLNLAILYAANHGARIISISLGGQSNPLGVATEYAIRYADFHGCIIIAAAGNDNSNQPFYPAAYSEVTAVSAIDQTGAKASFSNYGDYIDLCAPGVNILTTMINGTYVSGTGTSFAAPFASGVAACLLSMNPNQSPDEVANTLQTSAEDLGPSGWDEHYGWGLVDCYAALVGNPIPEYTKMSSPIVGLLVISAASVCVLKWRLAIKRTGNSEP